VDHSSANSARFSTRHQKGPQPSEVGSAEHFGYLSSARRPSYAVPVETTIHLEAQVAVDGFHGVAQRSPRKWPPVEHPSSPMQPLGPILRPLTMNRLQEYRTTAQGANSRKELALPRDFWRANRAPVQSWAEGASVQSAEAHWAGEEEEGVGQCSIWKSVISFDLHSHHRQGLLRWTEGCRTRTDPQEEEAQLQPREHSVYPPPLVGPEAHCRWQR
jgi:hypothetical protein